MEMLTCLVCEQEWERKRTRGRKPSRCPDCAAGKPVVPSKKRKRKPRAKEPTKSPEISERNLERLPFTRRTSGWCTDYEYGPAAQHARCDGDLGKYRCPCECHGWSDNE